jgi:hypothetical protein
LYIFSVNNSAQILSIKNWGIIFLRIFLRSDFRFTNDGSPGGVMDCLEAARESLLSIVDYKQYIRTAIEQFHR